MDRNAGALSRRVEALDVGALLIEEDVAVVVRRDAPHRVVGGGLDRYRVRDAIHPDEVLGQVVDLRQALHDLLGAEVSQVEQDVLLLRPRTPTLVDLGLLGAGDDVAGAELHLAGSVGGHETVAIGVDQVPAFAPGPFGEQDSVLIQPGRVELHEFHVLEGNARAIRGHDAVAGVGGRI